MTTEEYETTIRPALAKFCGWTQFGYNTDDDPAKSEMVGVDPNLIIRHIPDPLHNAADAWALQSALLEKGAKVELYGFIGKVSCDIFPLSMNMVNARQVTPEAALVMATWEVVRQRRHET